MHVRVVRFEDVPGVEGVVLAQLLDLVQVERVRVEIAILENEFFLPKHRAGQHQVFYVVSGAGRVAGADDEEISLGPGSLVEWQAGEEHTSWADSKMTVLIVQERSGMPDGNWNSSPEQRSTRLSRAAWDDFLEILDRSDNAELAALREYEPRWDPESET